MQSDSLLIWKIVLAALLMIPFVVWTVALMYNSYSVSANLKGTKAVLSFIASFIIAEIISKLFIYWVI